MTTTAAAITIVVTALFAAMTMRIGVRAALILALAFRAGTKLRATVAAAITAATAASTLMVMTTAAAIAVVTTTFAGTFFLALFGLGLGLFGGIATEEAFQPAEEAGFFGFGNGGCGLGFECALFTTWLAGLLTTWFAFAAFAWAEFAAWFAVFRTTFATILTRFTALGAEVRAAFAAWSGVGGGSWL